MMECRCVSLLQQGGAMQSSRLRQSAGSLPHHTRSGASSTEVAFEAFLAARPHVFSVRRTGDGPRVALASGNRLAVSGMGSFQWPGVHGSPINTRLVHSMWLAAQPLMLTRLLMRSRLFAAGAEAFLRYKRRLLEHLARKPHYRAEIRQEWPRRKSIALSL